MDLYLGIDLGTSYFKLGLFDGSLALRGLGRVPVPNGGEGAISEVAPAAFWEALATGLRAALEQAGAQASDIRALSWSSQANSFLLFDGDRIPLTPLVLWNDRRVEEVPDSVRALGDCPDFMAVTGVGGRPSTFSAIAKIDWFRANLPDL
jgi:sugar (pentulose or hexulose) kinase